MGFYAENKRRLVRFTQTFLFVSAAFYFSYHLMSGNKGLLAMLQLSQKVQTAQSELDEVRMERVQLQHWVDRMYGSSLDTDLLDEQSRKLLGYAGKGEVVYFDTPDS